MLFFACYSYFQLILMFISGVIVYDYELKIGWGKSVALPSQALPAPPPGHMAIRNKEVAFFFVLLCCIKFCIHLTFFLMMMRLQILIEWVVFGIAHELPLMILFSLLYTGWHSHTFWSWRPCCCICYTTNLRAGRGSCA